MPLNHLQTPSVAVGDGRGGWRDAEVSSSCLPPQLSPTPVVPRSGYPTTAPSITWSHGAGGR